MRLLFLLLFQLSVTASLLGQDWTLGVKGGVNISSARVTETSSDFGNIVGFHAGGYGSTPLVQNLHIQPEVQFSWQGWKNLDDESVNVFYVLIPVVVKYYLVEQFNIHAGGQIGFLVAAEDDREDILKGADFGAVMGAEYQINPSWGAGVRYNLGLVDILDRNDVSSKINNRLFQVYATYALTQ